MRTVCSSWAACLSSRMISLFGTVHISANAVANNLDAIGCIVGNAMGLAMITVIGRCIGAQDLNRQIIIQKSCFCGIISPRARSMLWCCCL